MKRIFLHILLLAAIIAMFHFIVQIAFITPISNEFITNRFYSSLGFMLLYIAVISAVLHSSGHFDPNKFKPVRSLPSEVELNHSIEDIVKKCGALPKYQVVVNKQNKVEIHAKMNNYSSNQKLILESLETTTDKTMYLISSSPSLFPFKLNFYSDVILVNELIHELEDTTSIT